MYRLFFALVLTLAAWLPLASASASEYIGSFHQDIALAKDGAMTVTETITVSSEGDRIKRGIFRDFPLTFVNERGRTVSVDFDLLSVSRDGQPDDYHTESITGGTRIYIGNKDVFIPDGIHIYKLTYKTNRQIRYFPDHDELFWNVTGNGWDFEIRNASATVNLPEGARARETIFFTGALGATEKNATVLDGGSTIEFATTQALGPHEGLTIGVKFDKGMIDPPTAAQQNIWLFWDSLGYVFGFGGFIVVFAYYLYSWTKVGRDPPRGVMVPRWDPPDGISPALVNYIDNKGFSGGGWTAFSATALNLAVKGYVVLEDLDKSITIRRTDKPVAEKLQTGEAKLLAAITGKGTLVIDKANGERVKSAGESFRSSIEAEHRGKYYKFNAGYIVLGVIMSIVAFIGTLAFGALSDSALAMFLGSIFVALVIASITIPLIAVTRRIRMLVLRILLIIVISILLFIGALILLSLLVATYFDLKDPHDYVPVYGLSGILLLNLLYFFIMGAPTQLGAKMMNGIDGLRQYLTLAEKDRMNMAGAPTMSPQHFETLLPYAVALGVEKPWANTFETWLTTAAAGATAASYQPAWYSGSDYDTHRFGERIGGFSSSMSSTIASTIPSPPPSISTSGFSSGGSSGGGGGGGGGGGW